MIIVLKRNENGTNYFYDKRTNDVLERYDPENKDLVFVTEMNDGSVLHVDQTSIQNDYGLVYFDYLDNRYIIDDGFQNTLIRAGYIVGDDYDKKFFTNIEEGLEYSEKMRNTIYYTLMGESYVGNISDLETSSKELKFCFYKSVYKYTVVIETNKSVVDKNTKRKFKSLPFYPFSKNMDSFGTWYISVFCQKVEDVEFDSVKYQYAENFIHELIDKINENNSKFGIKFKFERLMVKRHLNYIKNL